MATHRVFVEDDLAAYHLPFRAFYQECLKYGDSFLWNPYIFNGYYLHGDGQVGMLHPWHWLIYCVLPLDTAFMLDLLSSYPFALLGMYFFLRQRSLTREAALLGGMLFAFIGFNMNHYVHMAFVAVLAHIPWSLFALDRAAKSPKPWRWWALVIALGTSQIFLGFPQGAYYAWLVEGFYVLFLVFTLKSWRILPWFAMAKVSSLLIGFAQLFPTWEVIAQSFRATPSMDMQLSVSLHPLNFLSLLNPYLFQWRYFGPIQGDEPWDAPYMGAVATILLLFALIRFRQLRTTKGLAAFALILIAFGVLSSLGKYGFLYPLYAELPLVSKFRAHARHLCIAHTGLAILAAIAFSHLQQLNTSDPKRRWPNLLLFLIPITSLIMTLTVITLRSQPNSSWYASINHFTMSTGPLLIGATFVCLVSFLVYLATTTNTQNNSFPSCTWERNCLQSCALILLVLLTFADIGLYSLRHKPQKTVDAFKNEITYPPTPPGARIDSDIHPMFMNRFGMKGYRGVYGYTSFMPERRLDFTQELPLRLAGVEWRQTRHIASPELAAAKERGEEWVPLQNSLPRVRLLTQTKQSSNPAEDINSIDTAQTALVDRPVDLPPGTPGQITIITDRPGRIVVHTKTDTRQLLTISENFALGWTVDMDGKRAELLRINGDFIGTLLEPGDHEVHFIFAPHSFTLGLWISLAGVLLVPMVLWVLRRYSPGVPL
ncbi:MAG TPA: YfhO family protein [Candidatus Hydrogenedentes bacterium]|nr:YfhO family protein [Candidatus Hydrogenedentota bacterium]